MTLPFLKWAGGKQALLPQLKPLFPTDFARFVDPFLGGGSVFFGLAPKDALLGDANTWLIETYEIVRDEPDALLDALRGFVNTREAYLQHRAVDPQELRPVMRAALFVYLNKTCFRGLFRVNRKGWFNVPYGNYQRPYVNEADLRAASRVLQRASFRPQGFAWVEREARAGDFVYLDPPYLPKSATADFDRYTTTPFGEADHVVLAAMLRRIDRPKIRWALSHRDIPKIRELYAGFDFTPIEARREITLTAADRPEAELLIRNYTLR